jgi:ribonuclease Z
MKPLFHCKLLNVPFGDPALFIEILHERRALLFDLGDIGSLTEAKLLKLSHVFVSHAHMDHFYGFDRLLRVVLGRDKHITIYGPPGITSHVAGKLAGYTWNLVQDYPLQLRVGEISQNSIHYSCFICSEQFKGDDEGSVPFEGVVDENPHYTVESVELDHRIPSLAYSLMERFHINVKKDSLVQEGYAIGPWLRELKEHIWEDQPDDLMVMVPNSEDEHTSFHEVALGYLKRKIVGITPGQKIAYVADCCYTRDNVERIVELVQGADLFFCEAAFLEEDSEKARDKGHLTARQAGLIAREAGVKLLQVFHFSPRYSERAENLTQEAQEAFQGKEKKQ